ncbi:MAG TPA: VWA domain-containing protein [Candidatus Acidoferrales bacterium]|nr:VWA domain-containing protein [Candidatus Acidoferrales bacterium]
MKIAADYTLAARRFAVIVASIAILGAAAPNSWMHASVPESPAAGESPAPQILVAKPGKPKPAQGQDKDQPQVVTRVQVNIVRLYVTVRDKHNTIIPNLTKDDFRVYEDGQEQQIAIFSKDMTDPITLAMMIDTSPSQQGLLGAEQETASEFLRQILKKDDLALVLSFDSNVNLLADFTDSQELLQRAIQRAEINAAINAGPLPQANQAGTVLYDAVYQVCHNELTEQAGRKAMIILTDAQDEGSTRPLDEAIQAAQQANAVIHVLLIADRMGYLMQGEMYSGGSVAAKMAKETGGRVISIRGVKDLDKAFDQISEELRSQYVIGYYPTNKAKDGSFRKIKVETTTQGLKVLTREGYYAPSAPAQ